MKKTKTIPFLVESNNGHDTKQVKLGSDLQSEVEDELKKDKWVTIEKTDGSSELLTKKDLPDAELVNEDDEEAVEENEDEDAEEDAKDEELMALKKDSSAKSKGKPKTATKPSTPAKPVEEWKSKFENVTSATSTSPAKGG